MTAVIAAAIICVAAIFGLLLRKRLAFHSSSGFTLQTLIITAILVLVAVGATVILIALSRSNEDSLAESSSNMQSGESRHGIIDDEGNLSYTWRCSLGEEYVLSTTGDGGRCEPRCWGKLKPPEQGSTTPRLGISNDDFSSVVYSANSPGSGYTLLRGNSPVIALAGGSCLFYDDICKLNEDQREAVIRRHEDINQRTRSVGDAPPPSMPSLGDAFDLNRIALKC